MTWMRPSLIAQIHLMTMRRICTSFDTDSPELYDRYSVRPTGKYISSCCIPGDYLNEGRYVIGVNASSFRVKRFFQDEVAMTFSVDGTGAPGKQWAESRLGLLRPDLDWRIETK
jgi:lipopolysaccharide transport system ATP-binding protein